MNDPKKEIEAKRRLREARARQKKIVKIGDPSQRQSIRLPGTLSQLKKLVGALFEQSNKFQLWLDSGASGRAPGRGRRLITNETDYARIADGDVMVMVIDDRELDASDLGRIKSTMQTDFTPMPYARENRAERFNNEDFVQSKAKWHGESSHRLDYQIPPSNFFGRATRSKLADPKTARPESFSGGAAFQGNSTYQEDFKVHPFCQEQRKTQQNLNTKSTKICKSNIAHVSSYNLDFTGKYDDFIPVKPCLPLDKQRPEKYAQDRPETDCTPISCYQAEFIHHPAHAYTKVTKKEEHAPSKPFQGSSSYQRDFAPRKFVGKTVYIEPQAS